MTHPNSLELEAFAIGERSTTTAAHLAACDACASFVERARTALARGPSFDVTAVVTRAQGTARGRDWAAVAGGFAPVAAAAALLLFLGTRGGPELAAPESAPPDRHFGAQPSSGTSFKGEIQVAVIRDRDGVQTRFTGAVGVRPGDRLRLEVALDREQAILGAVLGDDGSWLELMPTATRSAGTFYSERGARIDDSPMSGTIFVGPPDAVDRARRTRTRSAAGAAVRAIRVEWEGRP